MTGQDSTPLVGRAGIAYATASVFALLMLKGLEGPPVFFKATSKLGFLVGSDLAMSLVWGVLLGAGLALTGEVCGRFTVWGRTLTRIMGLLLGRPHLADIILLAALSSLGEELLFRGILLPYMGLWGSSALFGLAHLIPRKRLWGWSVWAAGAGLAFGWLAIRSGGLLAPFIAHFTVNAIGLATLSYRRKF